jgi:hypothetical protein
LNSSSNTRPYDCGCIDKAPGYLRETIKELGRFTKALDMEEFANSGLSLLAAFLLADDTYEGAGKIPPHVLELDCQGSISDVGREVSLSGAEIKSNQNCKFLIRTLLP